MGVDLSSLPVASCSSVCDSTVSQLSHTEQCSTAMLVACGGTHSFAGLLVARFFQGVGACMALFPPDDLRLSNNL